MTMTNTSTGTYSSCLTEVQANVLTYNVQFVSVSTLSYNKYFIILNNLTIVMEPTSLITLKM